MRLAAILCVAAIGLTANAAEKPVLKCIQTPGVGIGIDCEYVGPPSATASAPATDKGGRRRAPIKASVAPIDAVNPPLGQSRPTAAGGSTLIAPLGGGAVVHQPGGKVSICNHVAGAIICN